MKRRHFLWYSFLLMAGCTATSRKHRGSGPNDRSMANNDPETIRFAIAAVQGLDELTQDYAPFRQALADGLEHPVVVFPS